MAVASFHNSQAANVLSLRDAAFASLNLSRFLWQPCQQVESLDQQGAKYIFADDEIKGYGAAYPLNETHFRLNLIVDPSHVGQGIGSLLLESVEAETVRQGGSHLQARLFEQMRASLKFALARGFTQIHTMRGMSLDAADFSFGSWEELGRKLAAQDFRLTTLQQELDAGASAIDKLAELYGLAKEGWPSPDPSWKVDSSDASRRAEFKRVRYPESFTIIKHRDEYVGFTSAKNRVTGTAVHPGFRNRGIAAYLKACDINRCVEDGETCFESSTASPAMQRVNLKLGYKFNGLAEVRLVKRLA